MPNVAQWDHFRFINACIAALSIRRPQEIPPHGALLPPDSPGYGEIGLVGTPTCFIRGVNDINAGFLGEIAGNNLLLVFRGTVNLPEDIAQDLEIAPVDWTVGTRAYGKVHHGFHNAMNTLWPDVSSALQSMNAASRAGITITGHSKGGAMAALAASLVKGAYPQLRPKVVTFAAPRVGDRDFGAQYTADGLEADTWRYVNQYDIIPSRPLNFEPLGTIVYINYILNQKPLPTANPGKLEFEYGLKAEGDYVRSLGQSDDAMRINAHQPDRNYRNCFYTLPDAH